MGRLNEKTVTFRIRIDQLPDLDRYAKKLKISRSHLIRNLIDTGLDDLRLLDKTGFLTLTSKGRDLFDVVRHA
ncbi:MAG TPA: hypothetical protein PKX87_08410, partial [Alphaproteobacteria bacterium]|nr:hypothetical protein [Alphaproteobacteria bacterium]